MEAFDPHPPSWTSTAIHARGFCCPQCQASSREAQRVWVNRSAPVTTVTYQRRWQEFYLCQCQQVWWAWSNERPSTGMSERYSQSES